MLNRLTKTATALGLSLTLALSAVGMSATPARADNSDAIRILGGIVALYAIGRAINEANARNDTPQHYTPPQRQEPPRRYEPPQRGAHVPHRPQQLVAPARCFIEGTDNNGYYRGYVRACMQNNASAPRRLPDSCLRRVHTQRGDRMIYAGRCLAQNGWVRG